MSEYLPDDSQVGSDPSGLKPGETFWNNYRIISVIGKGGVSTVYKAETLDTTQIVAIKVLHAHRSRDEELVRRFVREAQTTTKLDHPHAIHIYEWGIDQHERPFMIIEYLSGETLSSRIRKGNGLSAKKAVEIMEQVCQAIGEAHHLGIIHRDLKPDNIMLTTQNGLEDWVKVVDFGIAKLEPSVAEGGVAQAALTAAGAMLGTPQYMAPEQLRGQKADCRSDIYSLGVIMYEMLTGKPPFNSKKTSEIVVGHLNVTPESPKRVRMDLNIPDYVSEAVMRALSKNPAARPTTVQEFLNDLLKASSKSEHKTLEGVRKTFDGTRKTPNASVPTLDGSQVKPDTVSEIMARLADSASAESSQVDPVKMVCPQCRAVSSGANILYCLKCGRDNSGGWLPYERRSRLRAGFSPARLFKVRNRRLAIAVVVGLAAWAVFWYIFGHEPTMTGHFQGQLDHPLFAGEAKIDPSLLKRLQSDRLKFDLLMSQKRDLLSGAVTTQFGESDLEGQVIQTNPFLESYWLKGMVQRPEGNLELDISGKYNKLLRSDEWTVWAMFQGAHDEPVKDNARMKLVRLQD